MTSSHVIRMFFKCCMSFLNTIKSFTKFQFQYHNYNHFFQRILTEPQLFQQIYNSSKYMQTEKHSGTEEITQ